MSVLDGFELFQPDNSRPFITLRSHSITFSKRAVECLEYTEYVHMYIDETHKKVAFQVAQLDSRSMVFYQKPQPGKNMLVRISNKDIAFKLAALAGIQVDKRGIRCFGEYIEEEKLIMFDLTNLETKKDMVQ